MANFQYTALDARGQQTSGTISAGTEAEAISQLKSQGLYPTNVSVVSEASNSKKAKHTATKGRKTKGKTKTGGKIPPKTLMIHTRQLATLIEAGLPLLRSLTVLAKQEPNPVLKGTVNALSNSVQSGSTYSEALSQHPKIFNKLFVNMVKAGELGGVLELVLARLAEYMEKADKLKNKIISAAVYPIIVMIIAVLILVFLMVFIVPKFKAMFDGMGQQLPFVSRFVFGMSDFMIARDIGPIPNAVWLFAIIFGIFMLFKAWGNTKGGRKSIDNMMLKLPILGDVNRKSSISRFTRTLGTLVTSGVPILQALNITKETAGNVIISDAIEKIHDSVKEGESVVQPMIATKVFPDMVVSMVDVGEETGQLPSMLLKIAEVYDDEVDSGITALTSVIEPLMIVFLALVVGGIVVALFLPMIQIIQSLQ